MKESEVCGEIFQGDVETLATSPTVPLSVLPDAMKCIVSSVCFHHDVLWHHRL